MRVVAVSRRWTLRFGRGGYERVLDFVPFLDVISMEDRVKRPYRLLKWIADRSGNKVYNSISSGLEAKVMVGCRWLFGAGVHYLYGDYDYCYSGQLLRASSAKISVTLHNPESELRKRIQRDDYYRGVKGVIVLGNVLLEYARRIAPSAHISVIPHGVDWDFFTPRLNRSEKTEPASILVVGTHLRDWEWTRRYLTRFKAAFADVIVKTVVPEFVISQFEGCEIRNHYKITDEALRELYREAAFLLYAPKDCVASNAVLEAMSCGTPVLGLKRGAVEEYVGLDAGILDDERHLDDLVEAGVQLVKNPALRAQLGWRARGRAELYKWERVGKRVEEFLLEVHG